MTADLGVGSAEPAVHVWSVGSGLYAWLAEMPGARPSRSMGAPCPSRAIAWARALLWIEAAGGPPAAWHATPEVQRNIRLGNASFAWTPDVLDPAPPDAPAALGPGFVEAILIEPVDRCPDPEGATLPPIRAAV